MLANGVRFGCIGWRVDERAPGFIHPYGSNINLQGEIRTDGQFSQYSRRRWLTSMKLTWPS
jgi:hypothetical protein